MPYHRSRMALRPINRVKHVFDTSATLAAGVELKLALADTREDPTLANNGVKVASKINGIYLRVEVASNEAIDLGAIPNVYMMVSKNPGNNVTMPAPNAVGSSDAKRFVIHQEMTMIENKGQGSNGRTLFNGVIVVPKGFRRNGPDDQLTLTILCPALDIAVCVQCHYKEFS